MPNWSQQDYDAWLNRRRRAAVPIGELWGHYLRTGSIHRAAMVCGITGETARQWLLDWGYKLNRSAWTDTDTQTVTDAYANPAGVNLAILAADLKRSYAAIACKANELGITVDRGKQIRRAETCAKLSVAQIQRFERNGGVEKRLLAEKVKQQQKLRGHPRGMLGKHHTDETKRKISKAGRGRKVSHEETQRRLKTRLERYGTLAPWSNTGKRSWKAGWREIGGKRIYARSRWEANYARYLEFLKTTGQIIEWEHEPTTFWFNAIKRGTTNYTPDFSVTELDGYTEYHEVKGWMDPQSKTKIRRMRKYHPDKPLRVIDSEWFKKHNQRLRGILAGWES